MYSCRYCRVNLQEAMFQYLPRCWAHYSCWLKEQVKAVDKAKPWRLQFVAILRRIPVVKLKNEFPIIALKRWLAKLEWYRGNARQIPGDAEQILKEARRNRKCKYCKKEKPDVQLRPDGYERDVHNKEGAMHTACGECDAKHNEDI